MTWALEFFRSLQFWDWVLIAATAIQCLLIAYMYQPRWKAFLLTLPIPFTFLALSAGRNVDASNAAGLILLLFSTHLVRWLHAGLGLPILPSIVAGAGAYSIIGGVLAPHLPATAGAFWMTASLAAAIAVVVRRATHPRVEPGYRTPLPVWIKLPIIVLVVLALVAFKQHLAGFMAMFPLVSVITWYEARHSLWTVARQIPVLMLMLVAMLIVIRLATPQVRLGWALALAWPVYLAVLIPVQRSLWKSDALRVNA